MENRAFRSKLFFGPSGGRIEFSSDTRTVPSGEEKKRYMSYKLQNVGAGPCRGNALRNALASLHLRARRSYLAVLDGSLEMLL